MNLFLEEKGRLSELENKIFVMSQFQKICALYTTVCFNIIKNVFCFNYVSML